MVKNNMQKIKIEIFFLFFKSCSSSFSFGSQTIFQLDDAIKTIKTIR